MHIFFRILYVSIYFSYTKTNKNIGKKELTLTIEYTKKVYAVHN